MYEVLTLDETTAGQRTTGPILQFPQERITVREIIRERIYQEVQDYNRQRVSKGAFRGLVTPTEIEAILNAASPPSRQRREIDWKAQFGAACEAFEKHRVLVLVGDRQTESLDEEVVLARGVEVTFLRLVPLVGG